MFCVTGLYRFEYQGCVETFFCFCAFFFFPFIFGNYIVAHKIETVNNV